MIHRNCLIIDDNDQSETIDKLVRLGRSNGFEINCLQYNVGSAGLTDILSAGLIDITKTIAEYKKRYRGLTFHLVVCDYNFDDPNINGLELIRHFNHNRLLLQTPKIMISGRLPQIIDDIIKSNNGRPSKKINSLITSKMVGFYDRPNYEKQILNYFNSRHLDMSLLVIDILRSFPHLKFKSILQDSRLNNLSFEEVANRIENEPVFANEVNGELVSQIISYLSIHVGYE